MVAAREGEAGGFWGGRLVCGKGGGGGEGREEHAWFCVFAYDAEGTAEGKMMWFCGFFVAEEADFNL